MNCRHYPPSFAFLDPGEKNRIAPYLPKDFAHLPPPLKEAHIAAALKMISSKINPENRGRAELQADAYALRGELPERLKAEVTSLMQHYTRVIVATGKRNSKQPWGGGLRTGPLQL